MGSGVASAEKLFRHLVADEKHTPSGGEQVSLATTACSGCALGLGLGLAQSPGNDDLRAAYGTSRDEARWTDPVYRPETGNTDGGAATQAAWRALSPRVALILCFLHAFLEIRDRAKHRGATSDALREQVRQADHAESAGSSSQRLRRLREWARTCWSRPHWPDTGPRPEQRDEQQILSNPG